MTLTTAQNSERYKFILLSIVRLQTQFLSSKGAVARLALRAEINCLIREADLISAYGLPHLHLEDSAIRRLAKQLVLKRTRDAAGVR